jgi:hypothetical protein
MCPECLRKKHVQAKLAVGASNDPLEQEADRIADHVVAGTGHSAVGAAPLRIQRFTGQAAGPTATAPASADRTGQPGHAADPPPRQAWSGASTTFARRVHSDTASARSARHINAHAYTSGYDIVFGTGRFCTGDRRRYLLAHELTHERQQTGGSGRPYGASNTTRPIQRDESEPQEILGSLTFWNSTAWR